MGMAASQARLLSITARIHDVESKAQSIQNAKIQLSTQSDQVYQDYLDALDATTLTVKDYQGEKVVANFNNLCGRNPVLNGNTYALRDSRGRMIVSDDIYSAYMNFLEDGGYDAYEFALGLTGGDGGNAIGADLYDVEQEVYEEHMYDGSENSDEMVSLRESMDKLLADNGVEDYNDLESDEAKQEYEDLENAWKSKLYGAYAEEIFYKAGYESGVDVFNQEDFDYYLSMFKQIEAAGGCVSISDYNGVDGDAATNSEWLTNMIECGKITLEIVQTDKKTGEVTFSTSSPTSDTYVDYTATSDIDKAALAKAEAEYEHKTKEIDSKDKKYDMELSKLETERSALTTEYDSVKKVIDDNIERTFGIFS